MTYLPVAGIGRRLEAEPRCLFAEAHFGSLVYLFVVRVKNGFSLRLLRLTEVTRGAAEGGFFLTVDTQ